jgi:hypothetical protein
MSMFPDWIGIDVDSGGTTVVESVELMLVEDEISIEVDSAEIELEVVSEPIEIEVI